MGRLDRRTVLATGIASAALLMALLGFTATSPKPVAPLQTEGANASPLQGPASVAECLRLAASPPDAFSEEGMRREVQRWIGTCRQALAVESDNPHIKVSLARALTADQRPETVALLRSAAAQGDAEAYYEIYEQHKAWDRHTDRPPLVTRSEADQALHKAAELGHPFAMQMLAIRLDRGGIVKRDPVAARYWAERAVEHPAKNVRREDLEVLLGRLLAKSDKPDERARGLELLEKLNQVGHFGARADLAEAIRAADPIRARTLLEKAVRSDPGGAVPPLAQMLIDGEGGPADPKRALSMLRDHSDGAQVKGVLGQLYLEGKLVPRDVKEAVRLIDIAGQWDPAARLQVVQLLAANPDVTVPYPEHVLFDAAESAELDEPGALEALIDLKMSQNSQFRDKPGGCNLIETAAKRGDRNAVQRLPECRAS
jgi:TPR repeat protein